MKKEIEDRNVCISYDDFLNKIADELSFNYVSVSFGETHKDGLIHGIDKPHELYTNIFNPENSPRENRENEKKCRNILVVGSGATHDSYASIPLGSETKRLLGKKLHLQALLETNKEFRKKFEDEAKRILSMRLGKIPDDNTEPITDDKKFDFESYLLLMTKFFREQDIRKALQEMFNVRYAPCLPYEIIAHLFKHRFVDVIINFNFDEILDQAIKEEMGGADYHEIISDGDCKEIRELVVDGRLKIPVYIKPHGTITHKSTLRFTKDHYFDLPDDIKYLLSELFSGKLSDKSKEIDLINVFTVGFNLDSIEFNDIIKTNKDKVKLYSITYKDQPELFLDSSLSSNPEPFFKEGDKLRLLPTFFGRGVGPSQLPISLGEVFCDLYDKILERFIGLYKPRSIKRHLIFWEIFFKEVYSEKDESGNPKASYKDLEKNYLNSAYFKNRAIVELAIALARGRGKIELKELMTGRLGEVYKLYRKFHIQEMYNGLPDSLYDLAEIFKLKEEYSFSRNVHNISPITIEEGGEHRATYKKIFGAGFDKNGDLQKSNEYFPKCIVFRLLTADQTPEDLYDLFVDTSGGLDMGFIEKIVNHFKDLYESGYYQDVNAMFNDSRLYIFDHYYMDQILHTSLSYSYRFNEVFLSPEHWDCLLMVSDTGSILGRLYPQIKNKEIYKGKTIYLITCFEAIKVNAGVYSPVSELLTEHQNAKIFQQYEEMECKIIHKTLPYSDHHHHMDIFLKKVPDMVSDKNRIYQLSQFPTIQISKQDDCVENYIFPRSIYFYQKGFNTGINPLWIRGAFAFLKDKNTPPPSNFATNLLVKDHIMLLETFYAYHRKAISFEGSDGEFLEYLFPKDMEILDDKADENNDNGVYKFGLHTPKERLFRIQKLFQFLKDA